MPPLGALPSSFAETRDALQRVAVHVIARRRHDLVGRIGLRPTPGGFGMPAAGPEHDHEVLRTSGPWLVREVTGESAATDGIDLRSAALADAAALAGVDLDAELSTGGDTPPMGDRHAPLGVDGASAAVLADWYALGASALDQVLAAAGPAASPSVVQLWPEHFDLGCDLLAGSGRVNLGASPGDGFHPEPYVYLGPWGPERPGDPSYWNAPFGAVLGWSGLEEAEDPPAGVLDFLKTGLVHLTLDHTG